MGYIFNELSNKELEEIKNEIRQQVKFSIMTLELFWEELQNSTLPEELKLKLLENYKSKGE
jgi:hypothetical protein